MHANERKAPFDDGMFFNMFLGYGEKVSSYSEGGGPALGKLGNILFTGSFCQLCI